MSMTGRGTSFWYGMLPESLAKLGDITDIKPFDETVSKIDFSTHDSPENTREYKGGMITPGKIDITCLYSGSKYATVKGDKGEDISWEIQYADGSSDKGSGFIESVGKETPLDDKFTMKLSLQISGPVAFTPGS